MRIAFWNSVSSLILITIFLSQQNELHSKDYTDNFLSYILLDLQKDFSYKGGLFAGAILLVCKKIIACSIMYNLVLAF